MVDINNSRETMHVIRGTFFVEILEEPFNCERKFQSSIFIVFRIVPHRGVFLWSCKKKVQI
jgi:hypothetical protein